MRDSFYSKGELLVGFLRTTWERIFPWTFVRRREFNEFVVAYDAMLHTFWTREEEHYAEVAKLKAELEKTAKKRAANGRFA